MPAGGDLPENWYLQDVYPLRRGRDAGGRVLLPFPPAAGDRAAAVRRGVGLATDQEAIAIGLGALGVGLAWWMLGGLRLRLAVRALTTVIFATGTVWWWATAVGSTWYLAHLVAADIALVAVGRRAAPATRGRAPERRRRRRGATADGRRRRAAAASARRGVVAAGPLAGARRVPARARRHRPAAAHLRRAVLRPRGRRRTRRAAPGLGRGGRGPARGGAARLHVPHHGLALHPGYDYQYRLEAEGYPTLGYNPDWSVEDPRYVPQNLGIMLGALPEVAPDSAQHARHRRPGRRCARGPARSARCSTSTARSPSRSTSGPASSSRAPGLLLALFASAGAGGPGWRIGAAAAVVLIALFNLAHFSQGWVQWGYRFSLDFLPFLLPMVALGAGARRTAVRGCSPSLLVVAAG